MTPEPLGCREVYTKLERRSEAIIALRSHLNAEPCRDALLVANGDLELIDGDGDAIGSVDSALMILFGEQA